MIKNDSNQFLTKALTKEMLDLSLSKFKIDLLKMHIPMFFVQGLLIVALVKFF